MLLCSALLKSLAYLSPCTINFTPFLGDGIPHKVNLELWGLRVRLKVDGIAYYPESLAKPMCRQHWSFFNIDTNRQGKLMTFIVGLSLTKPTSGIPLNGAAVWRYFWLLLCFKRVLAKPFSPTVG